MITNQLLMVSGSTAVQPKTSNISRAAFPTQRDTYARVHRPLAGITAARTPKGITNTIYATDTASSTPCRDPNSVENKKSNELLGDLQDNEVAKGSVEVTDGPYGLVAQYLANISPHLHASSQVSCGPSVVCRIRTRLICRQSSWYHKAQLPGRGEVEGYVIGLNVHHNH